MAPPTRLDDLNEQLYESNEKIEFLEHQELRADIYYLNLEAEREHRTFGSQIEKEEFETELYVALVDHKKTQDKLFAELDNKKQIEILIMSCKYQ